MTHLNAPHQKTAKTFAVKLTFLTDPSPHCTLSSIFLFFVSCPPVFFILLFISGHLISIDREAVRLVMCWERLHQCIAQPVSSIFYLCLDNTGTYILTGQSKCEAPFRFSYSTKVKLPCTVRPLGAREGSQSATELYNSKQNLVTCFQNCASCFHKWKKP